MNEDAQLELFVRKAPAWEALRAAVARAFAAPVAAVGAFDDPNDPPVRIEVILHDVGFQSQVDLYLDLKRVRGAQLPTIAAVIAAAVHEDVAYEDEASQDPFRWFVVDALGSKRIVMQKTDDVDGLLLDEG